MAKAEMICTTCGYVGSPVTLTKGSIWVELVLWLMMLFPGLLYSLWRLTNRTSVCPACKNPTMIPLATPKAQELVDKAGGLGKLMEKSSSVPKEKKSMGLGKVALITVGVVVIIRIISLASQPNSSKEQPVEPKELVGNVVFSGTQFKVTNKDATDWTGCYFELNGKYKYPSNAPSTVLEQIKTGETIYIDAGGFTLSDGTRYNSYATKQSGLTAVCGEKFNHQFGHWTWD